MKNKCKNCKYWEGFGSDYKGYGQCKCEKFVYDKQDFNINIEKECKTKDCLFYTDSEGWSASFSTGENFGCVHFESKNK